MNELELECNGIFEENNNGNTQKIKLVNKEILWHCDLENIMEFVKKHNLLIYIKRNKIIIHDCN